MMCACDVRLTSNNASVTLCSEFVDNYCQSATHVLPSSRTSVVINASKVMITGCVVFLNDNEKGNKKAQLSLTNPRNACEKFARFT